MVRRNARLSWSAAIVLAAVTATPAAAQSTSAARVEVSVNVGAQTGAGEFTTSKTRPSNGNENETIDVDHDVKTALGFNVGAAVRLVPKVWVGVQYAMTEMKPSASITTATPHPILFNTPRTVEGSLDNVTHKEQNVHVDLMYALPLQAMDVKVMAGPTFFNVKQNLVTGVVLNETYPFDTASFASATTKQVSKGAVGFNAGVDISRPVSSKVGIGALLRYSRADVKFDDPDVGQQTVKAGGFEVGGGIRVRF
jgi:hypothetical protein